MKHNDIIVMDTETTGFLEPTVIDINKQPHIIEIYACRLDQNYNIIDEIDTLLSIDFKLPSIIKKVTKISDKDLIGKPKFISIYQQLIELFIGTRTLVGHNIGFDAGLLWVELSRIEKEVFFPWPANWYCTIEHSFYLENKRLKLGNLYERITGESHEEKAHRAKADVMATIECYKWLIKNGK